MAHGTAGLAAREGGTGGNGGKDVARRNRRELAGPCVWRLTPWLACLLCGCGVARRMDGSTAWRSRGQTAAPINGKCNYWGTLFAFERADGAWGSRAPPPTVCRVHGVDGSNNNVYAMRIDWLLGLAMCVWSRAEGWAGSSGSFQEAALLGVDPTSARIPYGPESDVRGAIVTDLLTDGHVPGLGCCGALWRGSGVLAGLVARQGAQALIPQPQRHSPLYICLCCI